MVLKVTRYSISVLQKVIATLVLTTATAQAADAPLWEGHWSGNANWCERAGDVGDETPTYYGKDGLFGMEWSCDVAKVQETGLPNSWVLNLDCLDAGYSYQEQMMLLVTHEDRLLILGESGVTENLVRCKK
ncbi:hypothetical protein FEE96_05160 [Parasedimentitalea maritima]|uniref:Uncharacterized protein n=1 Tax=Parasedimentitalea maritima TaxID=2578117 RepID=A0ABY2UYE6_9RHOB|nr:hypothetical protein [Zongyanglinia marina]TLP67913.1 hypothetical protein FEE96_05160 [Zongyanglinia marina]